MQRFHTSLFTGLPHFGEVNLIPEEQEALRKKEERKASGKQKEYEDRIKTEKRRKMEAKKAALRAEDMANAGSVPQQEPQKGNLPARVVI